MLFTGYNLSADGGHDPKNSRTMPCFASCPHDAKCLRNSVFFDRARAGPSSQHGSRGAAWLIVVLSSTINRVLATPDIDALAPIRRREGSCALKAEKIPRDPHPQVRTAPVMMASGVATAAFSSAFAFFMVL